MELFYSLMLDHPVPSFFLIVERMQNRQLNAFNSSFEIRCLYSYISHQTPSHQMFAIFFCQIFIDNQDDIAIVLCGSETTKNSLFKGKQQYQNINVLCELSKVDWKLAEMVKEEIKTTSCCGDWVDALAIALDIIRMAIEVGTEYEKTQIVLFSPFESPFMTSNATESAYVNAIVKEKTELLVISSNLDGGSKSLTDGGKVALRLIEQVRITK